MAPAVGSAFLVSEAVLEDMVAVGYHAFNWLEKISGTVASTTIFGYSATGVQSNIRGRIRM